MNDKISIDRINRLHPKVRDTFKAFIEEAEAALGITLRVVQGLRTIAEQNALYAQGRTKPGKIVTNAKGGSSLHNYGLAIDVGQLLNKAINWNFDYNLLRPFAKKYGLTWGADWDGDGKTKAEGDKDEHLVDMPHFQLTFGFTWKQLLAKTQAKDFIPGTEYVSI